MKRSFIGVIGIVAAFAATAAGQSVTVVGTGDPSVDVPAVQAAVAQGGRVILQGHFSFDATPTVTEQPSSIFSDASMGMVLISNPVSIIGMVDDSGEMTVIQGGSNPFYIEAPGSRVAIQNLHFVQPTAAAIRVTAASGLAITCNRIEGVAASGPFVPGILVSTAVQDLPPTASQPGQPDHISGTLVIARNHIDMNGMAGKDYLGIVVFAVGVSPGKEVDLYISGNNVQNVTERPIEMDNIGGRAYVEWNTVTTGAIPGNVTPASVIHVAGSGTFLVAHNSVDCGWPTGAGIQVHTTEKVTPVTHAVVVDNDVTMSAQDTSGFDSTSAGINVMGAGNTNMVLNNRIHGHAKFAVSAVSQSGQQKTSFITNDLSDFTSVEADVFVDVGATQTVVVGGQSVVEDHGTGTVVVPVH